MGELREPPHSIETEQAVLGGVIVWPDRAGAVFTKVASHDFYAPKHQAIADGIQLLLSQPYDVVLLADLLRSRGELERVGGMRYLVQLADVPTAASLLDYYAERVREMGQRRRIIASCAGVIEAAFDESRPIDTVMELYQDLGSGHRRQRGVPV